MPLRSYQLVLSGTPKRLSDVYGGAASVVNAATDIPYRQLCLQAEGADLYIGGDATVSTTSYGGKAIVTGQTLGSGSLGPFETGPLKLSDLWAVGAGATLHILGVPF
ncbi:MAG TPA: hypothetical protein VIX41_07580 [Acidimicrobiales bacterium]